MVMVFSSIWLMEKFYCFWISYVTTFSWGLNPFDCPWPEKWCIISCESLCQSISRWPTRGLFNDISSTLNCKRFAKTLKFCWASIVLAHHCISSKLINSHIQLICMSSAFINKICTTSYILIEQNYLWYVGQSSTNLCYLLRNSGIF